MATHGAFVVDAAQYIIEPPDLWTTRVAAKHKELAPKVVAAPDAGQAWSYENGAWLRPLGLDVATGHSPVHIKDHGYSYASVRKGFAEPTERLADMRVDEIDAAAIYPTYGLDVRNIKDRDLHVACIQAYNDGVWDWCQAGDGKRLYPMAMLPSSGRDDMLAELGRALKKGFRGLVFSGWPNGGDAPTKEDDTMFAQLQEAGAVLNILRGAPANADRTPTAPKRYIGPNGAHVKAADPPLEMLLAQAASIKNTQIAWLVLTGITERFENLHCTMIDAGAGWIRTTGELLDWNYRYAQFYGMNTRLKYVPSDYVKRNFKATFKDERFVVVARKDFGDQYLLWSSNYPNSTSSWPNSGRAIAEQLEGVPENERREILGETFAMWYGVKLPAVAAH